MRLSASQIQTFSECQRKWAWRAIEGVEEPPNAAAERGRAVHAELEKYLRGGEIDFTTEIGYIAAAGLEHLPKPSPELLVEQEFHFEGPSGHSYLGYKDLEVPGTIFDHKTTSDLKWQKTADELRQDIQATLYAVDYFRNHPEEPDVELRWIYYQTRNTRKSAVTRLRVNQAEVWHRFLEIEKIAERMHAAIQSDGEPVKALDLPPNINHCAAYGGCPHQGRCNLSPFDKMRSHVEQNKLTMLLKSKNGAAAQPAPPAPTPARPEHAFAPGGAHHGVVPVTGGNKLLARLQAQGAPAAAVAPVALAPVPAAINPPEYQPPPVAATVPAPAPASVQEASAELAGSLAQGEPQEAKRGRGRPAKAALPATGLAVKIKTLYLNCGPVGVQVDDATKLIVRAKQRIATEGGLADYRFAEYGQGPGMLALATVAELDALEGVLPALRLDTTTPEGAIVAVELVARAELVVR
jgi:PD-(D/E)XK nuclease superfamily protein